jgi:hypothetical protein
MVPRNDGDVGRRTKHLQPLSGLLKFTGKTDVGQVACNRDVIERQSAEIVTQGSQDLRHVLATAPESPGQIAERALVQEIADLDINQRCEMEI